jgi:hypothetical protein
MTTITYYTLAHKVSLLTQCVLTGWLLSYQSLALIITHCHTRRVFSSRCEFTSCRTPLNNWLVGLLLKHWMLRRFSSAYNLLIVPANNAACFVLRNCRTCSKHVTRYSPTPVACDVTTSCCVEAVFQYCCVTSSRLRGTVVYWPLPSNEK